MAVSGPFFIICFEHYLRKLCEEVKNIPINIYNINNLWLEQRHSNLPNQLVYADDYDFITEDEKNKSMVGNSRSAKNTIIWKPPMTQKQR